MCTLAAEVHTHTFYSFMRFQGQKFGFSVSVKFLLFWALMHKQTIFYHNNACIQGV